MIFVCIASTCLAACSDPVEREPIQPFVATGTLTPLTITAQLTCPDFDMSDGCSFDVTGKTSCNLSENIRIGLHGNLNVINQLTQAVELELSNGYFELFDDDQFSYLGGNFQGKVYRSSNELKVGGIITVNYGKGKFQANDGELQVTIFGILNTQNEPTLNITIDIEGFIENK